jgi:hypothetical protein
VIRGLLEIALDPSAPSHKDGFNGGGVGGGRRIFFMLHELVVGYSRTYETC